jgi:hypothetical protein
MLLLFPLLLLVSWLVIGDAEPWWFKASAFLLTFLAFVGLVVALRRLIARLRFGKSELIMAKMPIIPGRETILQVLLPEKVKKNTYHLYWYQKKIWPKIMPGDEIKEKIELEQNAKVDLQPGKRLDNRLVLEFPLTVPENAETTQDARIPHVEWWLKVSAPGETFNFSCEFQLPVFKVANEDWIETNPAIVGKNKH